MNKIHQNFNRLILAMGLVSAVLFSSCGGSSEITEGVIEFEITYPYYQGSGFMASMLPDKMTMKFKDGVYKSEVAKGNFFSSAFIVDCNTKKVINLFHFGTKKLYCIMTESDMKKLLKKEPIPQYLETNDGDSLAGFLCKKTVAYYEELEQPDVSVYSTNAIKIPDPNWWTPFHEVKDVLLGYEVERFDFRMRFTAVKFEKMVVEDSEFEVPAQYKKVSIAKIEKELTEVFKSLTK